MTEVNVPSLEVLEGTCPSDVSGVYLRNTEQPTHKPLGNYHPFDGDAMLHQVSLDGSGKCSYRNRFVKTDGFLAEQKANRSLWVGVSERDMNKAERKDGWGLEKKLKDTSSLVNSIPIPLNQDIYPLTHHSFICYTPQNRCYCPCWKNTNHVV